MHNHKRDNSTHTHTCTHAHGHAQSQTHAACTHTCTDAHVHMHAHMHMHMHIDHMRAHTHGLRSHSSAQCQSTTLLFIANNMDASPVTPENGSSDSCPVSDGQLQATLQAMLPENIARIARNSKRGCSNGKRPPFVGGRSMTKLTRRQRKQRKHRKQLKWRSLQ